MSSIYEIESLGDESRGLQPSDYDNENYKHGILLISDLIDEWLLNSVIQSSLFPIKSTGHSISISHVCLPLIIHGLTGLGTVSMLAFLSCIWRPYAGSRSFLNGQPVVFGDVMFEHDPDIHPFCSGLVISRIGSTSGCIVCVNGGYLYLKVA